MPVHAGQSMRNVTHVDAVVLGAGISGLVASKILGNEGLKQRLIIDEYATIGGNHISRDFGPYTFDIGTLIFQDDSPLMRYFPELVPLYHPIEWSISRVAPGNIIRNYPIAVKDEVFGGGLAEMSKLFGSIAWSRLRRKRIANADDYARYWIGGRLFHSSGLAHYIKRFNGVPATDIDPVFSEKRMGWIADSASVGKLVAKFMRKRIKDTPNQSFLRPRGGFDKLYPVVQKTLESEGVTFALGEKVRSISRDAGGQFHIATDARVVTCDRLISTIPVDKAHALCFPGGAEPLPYNKLISLFFSFAGERGFASSILYNFSYSGDWKRMTMFSDFFGKADGREFFGVEVVTTSRDPAVAAQAAAAFMADVESKKLFQGSLVFEGLHELDNAYPIYTHGSIDRADRMAAAMKAMGVETMGRQGRFDYLPTARQVTLAVEDAMGVKGGELNAAERARAERVSA